MATPLPASGSSSLGLSPEEIPQCAQEPRAAGTAAALKDETHGSHKSAAGPAAVLEAIPYCRHDMLLNYEKAQNDEVIQKIVGWLAATHWATIHAAPTSPPTNMPHARQPIFDLPFPTMPDPISMAL